MANLVERFKDLFVGGEQAYGEWDTKKGAVTRHGAPSLANYQAHLEGKVGLGLVPIQLNGLCQFAAIDIDIDTINHDELYKQVRKRRFPLTVCRSKSGGAHLYMFMAAPGLPAGAVQDVLKRWATLLGYPQAEIFPKQTKVSVDSIGNWINLPYFAGDATTRYAIGPSGAASLEEFVNGVELYDATTVSADEAADSANAQLPPCLAALTQHGVGPGQRNQGLFNFAVFYRKSQPGDWESAVTTHNAQFIQPSLEYREVQGIIKSVARAKYQYLCDQAPIAQYCDRQQCLKLPFGVNHMPWDERGSFDDLLVSHLRKLGTSPPKYILEVNGHDITLDWENFYNFKLFKASVGESLNLIVGGMKQPQWEQQVRDLLAKREDIEAPEDASMQGLVIQKFHEFLTLRERAQNREDLLRGLPVQDGPNVLFRASDLHRYLQGSKLDKLEGSEIFLALRRDGCVHRRVRINGRVTTVWSYPLERVNEQTEAFAIPDFSKDLDDEGM
jgi:hypothetical protein